VFLCKNNVANIPEKMDRATCEKYFRKQIFLNLLPDWVTCVGNALYHSLKEKGFQNNGQGGKQN
jgi:hypothetical protein